ncbi:hypothetical protein AWJ20_4997 [Sugiyamaella lignohabitans]|uniref:DUF155 domain-containing protein n=1 Tax=Sugiyamaella lignohabitans TaxID=796027 RepID=A0A167EG53_9ASCO|nr:uncharacterized protein AWJ20_4997 [Sugiyamaella lignohabitans]ANB14041.1 hypothetical protein AWJ20_4997 [Sugiyamaella lignohabitans]
MLAFQSRLRPVLCKLGGVQEITAAIGVLNPSRTSVFIGITAIAANSSGTRLFHLSAALYSVSGIRQKPPKSNKQAAQPSLRHVPTGTGGRKQGNTDTRTIRTPIQPDHNSPYYDADTNNSSGSLRTCTTASTCEHYDLAMAVDLFYKMGLRSATVLLPGEMVHVKYPFSTGKVADVLVLSNGTVVAWGMSESEVMDQLVPVLEKAEIRHYKVAETEDMDYVEEVDRDSEQRPATIATDEGSSETRNSDRDNVKASAIPNKGDNVPDPTPLNQFPNNSTQHVSHQNAGQTSTMVGDVIYIRGETSMARLLDKAAFSSGLARNTKLAALEISLDNYIKSIKELSDNLATGRKIELRGSEVLQITGKLLQIRGHLNLYSELIETPDLYWSEPQLEQLYSLISRKLDVSPRIAILNKRLDYASELAGILKSHISEEQSTRLEWMIIILITVEVCFEIVHFCEKYWPL